ncbi:MAG TPA: right-handed parallel beta-helix repeat-containing protein [Bryobacteraceae bacterium]|jgi:uncharacterized protein (TIGR03437 family)|nr:right-handed parallel beta-helix repeat-containing protein [Bryobacteraceae bacterium]
MLISRGSRAVRILTGFLALSSAYAADYYISPNGSDNAAGTLVQPFQTIQHAAAIMVAGDTAYIRAGIYRETVTPARSGTQSAPIRFMPYNGESVTVSGADVVPAASWAVYKGSIYKTTLSWVPDPNLNQVFVDGQMMIEARWPNTSLDISHPTVAQSTSGTYIDGGTGLSTGTITDPNLSARPDGYWNGAVLHAALGTAWVWQTCAVTKSTSSPAQLTFTFTKQFDPELPGPASPYYLTGKLSELDTAGEFFLENPSNIYLWTPAGDSPAQHTVEVKRRNLAFNIYNLSFITVQGLNIFAATIWANNSSYVILDSLNLKYVSHYSMLPDGKSIYDLGGSNGVLFTGSHSVLRNSTISYSANSGVTDQGSGDVILNNTIHDTDYTPDYSAPVQMGSTGLLVAWNTVYNTARNGIDWYAPAPGRIVHNEIYDVGLQTNDLGCTYTYSTDGGGTEIAYNVCHDVHGLLLNNTIPYTGGIYLDNNTSTYVVHHNVVWNSPFASALNSVSTNNKSFNNTFVGTVFGLTVYSLSGPSSMPGTQIKNNIFTAPLEPTPGADLKNNILFGTDPQFVDPANHNYQLKSTSPAIRAGLVLPPYTNGFSGTAPDIGAYDHAKPAWRAGVQPVATVAAPSYAPILFPGTVAAVNGPNNFDSGSSVIFTDGAGIDFPLTPIYVVASPPVVAFQIPSAAVPGIAVIAITNSDGAVSLASAPLFAGTPSIAISAAQGSGQSAVIAMPFTTALQAAVKDGKGNPLSGVEVTFTAPLTGAGGTFSSAATVITNGSGIAVSPGFSANAVSGTYSIIASATGVGALAAFTLTNTPKLSQTITFGSIGGGAVGSAPLTISANASSGLPVTFSSATGLTCSVSGTSVSFVGGGVCVIVAAQTGNATYAAAAPVMQTIQVKAASDGPAIAAGGIGPLASLSPTIQPGSLINIYGTNLSTTIASWNNDFPTSLGNVTVTINGKKAYLLYVSPYQIDLQAPDDSTAGPVNITVTTEKGSWTTVETLAPVSPAFSVLDAKHVAGIILRSDGSGAFGPGGAYDIVGPTGTSLGYRTVAARAGDVLELFGVGFGPTSPPVPAGQLFSGAADTANALQLVIGGTNVTPFFAGLSSAGLYQINVIIPPGLGTGDVTLEGDIGGTKTQSGVVISLQ